MYAQTQKPTGPKWRQLGQKTACLEVNKVSVAAQGVTDTKVNSKAQIDLEDLDLISDLCKWIWFCILIQIIRSKANLAAAL